MAVSPNPSSATVARVGTSTTAASLLAAGAARKMVHIQNESAAILYVLFGAGTVSATNYTFQMAAGAYYESPPGFPFGGAISGILASGTGNAQVTSY